MGIIFREHLRDFNMDELRRRILDELRVPAEMRTKWGIQCRHPTKELRRRRIKNGIYFQCLDCGSSVGVAQSKNFATLNSPEWDTLLETKFENLRKSFFDRVTAAAASEQKKKEEAWQSLYHRHVTLMSPLWKLLREKVKERCLGVCEGCMDRPVEHVHHKTYDHLGNELLFELVGLCVECHEKIHPHMREGV